MASDVRWIMRQTWRDLLFAHWRVPSEAMRRLVPLPLELDTFDGTAWIGVVPFFMTGIRGRCLPPLPWLSETLELNVRTYVTFGGRSGVYFFSLDAASGAIVKGARATYGLPYFRARMDLVREGDKVQYRSSRIHQNAPAAEFAAAYQPIGEPEPAVPGSLTSFLTDRFTLFNVRGARVSRADIAHAPWPLQPAEAEIERNTMTAWLGVELADAPLLHFSRSIDVGVGRLRVV